MNRSKSLTLAIFLLVTLAVFSRGAWSAGAGSLAPLSSGATWRDDFDASALDARWSWLREDPTHWSLTDQPGFLRITTQEGTLYQDINNMKNVLLQPAPAGDFEIQTRLLFAPTENIQAAGLIVYEDDDNVLTFERAFCGLDTPCVGNAIYFDLEEQGQLIGGNFATNAASPDEAYLRLKRAGAEYTAYYSADGTNWAVIGTHVTTSLLPSQVGLWASNSTFGASEITADFDYFLLDAQPHRVLLPLVAGSLQAQPAPTHHLVPDSAICAPNAGVAYYQGVVRDRTGNLQNGVCVHVAFFGPRNTKCSGCDGVGDGNWGFAPFGGPAPANIPVEIFIVPCPAYLPPGGQSDDWGDLTPLSDKWLFTTTSTNMQCTGITFMEN